MTITAHSSLLPTQQAIWTALTGSSAFTTICSGPFDPAPTNQPFPYAAFGTHIETNWYQFQKASKEVELVIHVYSQQPTFTEALTIIDVITNVFEAKSLTLPGGNFTNAAIIFVSAIKIEEADGLTRHVEGRWKAWNNAN